MSRNMATVNENPRQPAPSHFMATSGAQDPVWIHTEPYSNRPRFPALDRDLDTEVCIIGSGISGIQTAYELVTRGHQVVMIEARDILSGETGRTSGHLASSLDDGYTNIAQKHGDQGALYAAQSHSFAIDRVGEIVKKHDIECEYRKLPGYTISQWDRRKQPKKHDEDVKMLKEEVVKAKALGLPADFKEGFSVKGWDGEPDQRDAAVFEGQATFHPTKYLIAVLNWLKQQPNFTCYTHTRAMNIAEKGIEIGPIGTKSVEIKTLAGHTITCAQAVEATCVPLQKLSVIAEMEFDRTYCIAIRVPKGSVEDCLLYDSAEEYKYVRLTHCDDKDDYMVVGGCDHKVGQEEPIGRYKEIETWVRERFPQAGSVDYAWSGQIFEPVDYMAFIGLNPGNKHTYIITGDSGNGLTHAVIAGRIIATTIEGKPDAWASAYNPSRVTSLLKSGKELLSHDLQINAQYKRFLQSDIQDIEDLPNGEGGVLNPATKSPMAVYKDDEGKVHKFSALCPHLKGVVCWNRSEKSWDCPVHGSRFSKDGICVMGPSKGGLNAIDDSGKASQQEAMQA
ncbi:hypothetical protein BAUCODRAFT_150541 [Baudoinia panamericana UAMH 10762]|uniref:Rieske domain-containing protein n=1 Tax=Baudoinia panamericana (strain UAMH 10762) TaxID=717646 RepID=M2N2H2_BAUPA|nr:uncharacterized protein BAUCODRAFT_150541 [Baudoinia panamericana UAMH 10762]EMC93179.1 hypothetical protein BAUCODRAFT_150541 [Baudoinia panamericana UAMH 10762]